MLFPTATFALFFVVVYLMHLLLAGRPRWWKMGMLGASFVFYGWWDWRLCGLLALSAIINWAAGAALSSTEGPRRAWITAAAIVFDLGLLGVFKYYGFFTEAVGSAAGGRLPLVDLVLPIGISFFTFQALSYVVDVHRRTLGPRSLLEVALYLAFFPQLVAGPIVRASEFLPQLDRLERPSRPRPPVEVSEAAWLIGRGLFKKVVVATYLAESVVDPVFAAPSLAGRWELVLALYGYAVQIYADFSGYTDMATGIALLLGFRFPMNFDRPYGSRSIQEFWRRWHMTLSRWLRDYLYIPLGGSRGSEILTYRNLMLTMVLGGLWHGAGWKFLAWGSIHGLALVVCRITAQARSNRTSVHGPPSGVQALGAWLLTFHLVVAAGVPFRADTFGQAGEILLGLLSAPFGPAPSALAVGLIVTCIGIQVAPGDLGRRLFDLYSRTDPALQSTALGIWIAVVVALGPDGVAPFIYFQF